MKKFNEKSFRFDGYSANMKVRFYAHITPKYVRCYIIPTSKSLLGLDVSDYEVSKSVYIMLYVTIR